MPVKYTSEIASELQLAQEAVSRTIELLADEATVPFIARYRKEATGGLDEVAIINIRDRWEALQALDQRKQTILKTIEEQGKLTDELCEKIEQTRDAAALEDLYLPYKPKRKTRATEAIAKGLEPLADLIWAQQPLDGEADEIAAKYVDAEKGVADVAAAWAGARDIVAERVSELADLRGSMRDLFFNEGVITAQVKKGKEKSGAKFRDYFDYTEKAKDVPSHRMLAIGRGEGEKILSIRLAPDRERALDLVRKNVIRDDGGPLVEHLEAALVDGYDRLLAPSLENQVRKLLRERADEEAIRVFAKNLRNLLMASPLGEKWVLGVDPGLRTGCKLVAIDGKGDLLASTVIFPGRSKQEDVAAVATVESYCRRYRIEAVAVGNGTGSREVEHFLRTKLTRDQLNDAPIVMVNEAGASVYSVSETARREFPNQDATVRGAISIGRRLQDPLAELVKIEPKSIGVGQYQHDVEQNLLQKSLDRVVVSCVNAVGVELNTASAELLSYVAGLNTGQARGVVKHREKNGVFHSRAQLLEVPKLGPKTFEQAAGFLRIRHGENPLDSSAVHPERYELVGQMAADLGVGVDELMHNDELIGKIDIAKYVGDDVGEPTLNDILAELRKPGRDPRRDFKAVEFNPNVTTLDDLEDNMVLNGVVSNVTNFGAFVDIGVHQDGLVHVSELAHDFVDDPAKVVAVGDEVKVKVVGVDRDRKRISLSIKQTVEAPPKPKQPPRRRDDRPKRPPKGKRPDRRPERRGDRRDDRRQERGSKKQGVSTVNPFAALSVGKDGKVVLDDDTLKKNR